VRKLLSPGGAAHRLAVSRQAVEHSGNADGGRLLMWAFGHPGRKAAEVYIDFGARRHPLDATPRAEDTLEWHGSDPAQLLADAIVAYRLELVGARQEPLL